MSNFYVINLEDVIIEKNHPYTLVFKGCIPTYGNNNKIYTFKYDGEITYTDAIMPEKVSRDFCEQLMEDYGCGIIFDVNKVKAKLKTKKQYRMKM